jgi:arylsulfatase A-like enzyme
MDALPPPPNIILFVVDDMGWQDTSVPFHTAVTAWNRRYRTPTMERLAREGMLFSSAYAASPVCTPTRVSLMTGMNPARTHVTNWTLRLDRDSSGAHATLLPPRWNLGGVCRSPGPDRTWQAPTLPAILRDHGYRTIHVGKAHFGAIGTPGADPRSLGFDVNIAGHAAGGPGSYLGEQNYSGAWRGAENVWDVPGLEKYHGARTFLTEALTNEAVREVEQAVADGKPFFLNMAHYAVHVPFAPDERFYARYRDAGLDHTEAMYAALVEGMDHSLGRLMDTLDRLRVADRTAVVFISDNGGLSAHGRSGEPHTHNSPLRSGKGSAYEGGIRVPMIVRWPGVTTRGSRCGTPVISDDVFPTILRMASITDAGRYTRGIDGADLTRLLRGGRRRSGRALLWHYPHAWGVAGPGIEPFSAIRTGDWKLIYFYPDRRYELYNLRDDVGETHDLASNQPARLKRMARALRERLESLSAQTPIEKSSGLAVPLPAVPAD